MLLQRLATSSAYRTSPRALYAGLSATQAVKLGSSPAGLRFKSDAHQAESYESFNERYAKFFDSVDDLFELQRGLNNCFAYDLVPNEQVVTSALKAARRVNDFSTAVRIYEGIKDKVENKAQYQQYVQATEGVRKELGINTLEELVGAN